MQYFFYDFDIFGKTLKIMQIFKKLISKIITKDVRFVHIFIMTNHKRLFKKVLIFNHLYLPKQKEGFKTEWLV